jgi:hypothetical protein
MTNLSESEQRELDRAEDQMNPPGFLERFVDSYCEYLRQLNGSDAAFVFGFFMGGVFYNPIETVTILLIGYLIVSPIIWAIWYRNR